MQQRPSPPSRSLSSPRTRAVPSRGPHASVRGTPASSGTPRMLSAPCAVTNIRHNVARSKNARRLATLISASPQRLVTRTTRCWDAGARRGFLQCFCSLSANQGQMKNPFDEEASSGICLCRPGKAFSDGHQLLFGGNRRRFAPEDVGQ